MDRVEDLMQYGIMDSQSESVFNDWAEITAQVCGTPVSLVTFMDNRRQWYKSKVGTDANEVPLQETICQQLLFDSREELIINNTLLDDRTNQLTRVIENGGIRFYAGVPVVSPLGNVLGSICVMDYAQRKISKQQVDTLKLISKKVMEELERRKEMADLNQLVSFRGLKLEQLTAMSPGFLFALKEQEGGNLVFEFLSDGIRKVLDEETTSAIKADPNHLFRLMGKEKEAAFRNEMKEGFINLIPIARDCQLEALPHLSLFLQVNFQRVNNEVIAFGNVQNVSPIIQSKNMLESMIFDISHRLRRPVANISSIVELLKDTNNQFDTVELVHALEESVKSLDLDLNDANEKYQAYKLGLGRK